MSTYAVWCLEYGSDRDDARDFEASDHEHAALLWAEREDCQGDYPIVSGGAMVLLVALAGEAPQTFTVTGEMVPQYRARPGDHS